MKNLDAKTLKALESITIPDSMPQGGGMMHVNAPMTNPNKSERSIADRMRADAQLAYSESNPTVIFSQTPAVPLSSILKHIEELKEHNGGKAPETIVLSAAGTIAELDTTKLQTLAKTLETVDNRFPLFIAAASDDDIFIARDKKSMSGVIVIKADIVNDSPPGEIRKEIDNAMEQVKAQQQKLGGKSI